ncbi:hypothetical protein QR77_11695, partial [Streptomyces sp. 150FB]|uniref:ABC transporter permease n=1 Tax=Streptomyces sp. 150FB TaxID=1576605 RepID=UPI000589467C
ALAGWQFSRRPLRGAGPVLLLVLAVAMGVLAIGQGASWERSQDDQADFRTGASVRVLSGGAGDPGDAGMYAGLPGLRDAAPAYRTTTQLSGSRTATVLALDTAHAPGGMLLRDDLGDGGGGGGGGGALLDAIAPASVPAAGTEAGPAARSGIIVPDGTRRLELTLRLTDTRAPDGRSPSGSAPAVTVVLEDRYGFSYRMPVGGLPADGRPHTVTVDLAGTTGGGQSADGGGQGGQGGTPAEPMALTGLELRSDVPAGTRSETHRLTLDRLTAHDAEGTGRPVTVSDSFRWDAGLVRSEAGAARPAVPLKPEVTGQAPLSVGYETGSDPQPVQLRDDPVEFDVQIEAPHPRPPTVLPGVATDSFLKAAGAKTGQSVDVPVDGGPPLRVKIVRSVRQLPTTGPGSDADPVESGASAPESDAGDGGALLLDLRAVNQVLAGRQAASLTPTEWWLTASPGRTEQLADALRARPDIDPAQVLVRDETADELRHDPLGAGPQSALLAVAAAAAALAAVGFAVSSAGSLRERAAEFSVLHALGTPRRRLARLIALEQGVLIAVGLLVGLALGAVLTRAVVPLVVLTGQATQPVPRVLVELPTGQVGFLLAGVAVLPVLIVAAIALRRVDPALALRHQGGN